MKSQNEKFNEELHNESKIFAYQLYTILVYVLKVFHFYLFVNHFTILSTYICNGANLLFKKRP